MYAIIFKSPSGQVYFRQRKVYRSHHHVKDKRVCMRVNKFIIWSKSISSWCICSSYIISCTLLLWNDDDLSNLSKQRSRTCFCWVVISSNCRNADVLQLSYSNCCDASYTCLSLTLVLCCSTESFIIISIFTKRTLVYADFSLPTHSCFAQNDTTYCAHQVSVPSSISED